MDSPSTLRVRPEDQPYDAHNDANPSNESLCPTIPRNIGSSASTLGQKPLPPQPVPTCTTYGWRPLCLKPPFLLGFLAVTAAIIGILEALVRRSQSNGAVIFTSSTASVTDHLFNYGPQLVAVIYGLIWASVDHDVKRMEPYFQLAKPGGARAEDSLFLEYPYILHLFAPFIALHRRHWRVCFSATIVVLIMNGVAPLMSAILSKEQNIVRRETIPIQMASFIPQNRSVSTAFAYNAYSFHYLNGSLPPFTERNYAVLPFKPLKTQPSARNHTWTAESFVYQSFLDCEEAIFAPFPSEPNATVISTSTGDCSFQLPLSYRDEFSQYAVVMVDKGSFLPGQPEEPGSNCSSMKNQTLFGFWGRQAEPPILDPSIRRDWPYPGSFVMEKAAGIFCDAKYMKQKARVTVDAETRNILQLEPLEQQSPLETLNTTYWEAILLGWERSGSTPSFNISYTEGEDDWWRMPDHLSQMLKRPQFQTGISKFKDVYNGPVTDGFFEPGTLNYLNQTKPINVYMMYPNSFVPFGVVQTEDLDSLFDHQALQKMFSDAFQLLFAFGIGTEFTVFGESVEPIEATAERTYNTSGFVVDIAWTRVLQSVLAVIFVMGAALLALLRNSLSGITEDPGSIAATMARVNAELLGTFDGAEFMSPKRFKSYISARGLHYEIKDQKIQICSVDYGQGIGTPIVKGRRAFRGCNSTVGQLDRATVLLRKPWDLTVYIGVLAISLILGSGVLLTVLFMRNRQWSGFNYPQNTFLFNMYASYTPTITATFFEGFLVLLASYVTILYPFKVLNRGKAKYEPLTVNYESTAPHLQIFNGIRRRNYLLAFLSSAVLLANVLAVALGGLFIKEPVFLDEVGLAVINGTVEAFQSFDASGPSLQPGPNHIDIEFFYAANGDNLSFKRRPWVNNDFFFIPLKDPGFVTERFNYSAETWGIGLEPSCEAVPVKAETTFIEGSVEPERTETADTVDVLFAAENMSICPGWSKTIFGPVCRDAPVHPFEGGYFGYNNSKGRPIYIELAPLPYRELGLPGNWSFIASWSKYVWSNRTVTRPAPNEWNTTHSANLTVTRHSAELLASNMMRCRFQLRVVRARIHVTNLTLGLVDDKFDILETTAIPDPITNGTGLTGIVETFHEMVLRSTGMSNRTPAMTTRYDMKFDDPRPRTWLSLVLQQEGQKNNSNYDLYHYPELSRRSMERVYRRMFVTYMELHAEDFIRNVTGPTVQTTFKKMVTDRVLMVPVAYYISIALISFFLPVVAWAYTSLNSAFLTHQPVSIAGTIAAFYSSVVVDDIAGTEALGIKERARRLKIIGDKYGYGWHLGMDGKQHFGIDKEPLMR